MQITKFNEKPLKLGNIRISWTDFIFIIIFNISIVLVLINAILHNTGFWCQYPIFIMLYSYVIFVASIAGKAKKFLARIRNGLFIINALFSVTSIVYFISSNKNPHALIAIEWILPIILTATLITMLVTLFFESVSLLNILVAASFMLPQAAALFIVAIINPTIANKPLYSDLSFILSIVNFALYVLVIINVSFFYFIKVKKTINDVMHDE